jgi:lipopolysaccharide/colanic/teichoic acid biosynthesis glycosyltransferase
VYKSFGKRCLDLVVALLALVIIGWFMALVAIAIRIEDRGPAFFRQARVGRKNKPFVLYKFRSMPPDAPEKSSASAAEVRITHVGRFIRRTSIDELPQLINILRGEMSLVGPRPALPSQTALIHLRIADGVFELLPGLTGMAQINSYDGMPDEQKVHFDAKYKGNIGLQTDLRIMIRTVGYLLRPPPVY